MTFSGLPQVFYLLKDALEVITFLIPLFIHSFIISNHIILILPILTYTHVCSLLQRVGLSTYSIKECIQQQIMHGGVKHEIKDALKMICESLHLAVAQVWIPPPAATNNHDDKTFLVKLCGYRVAASYDHNNDIMIYYDSCDVLPLKIAEGLPGKTFQAK